MSKPFSPEIFPKKQCMFLAFLRRRLFVFIRRYHQRLLRWSMKPTLLLEVFFSNSSGPRPLWPPCPYKIKPWSLFPQYQQRGTLIFGIKHLRLKTYLVSSNHDSWSQVGLWLDIERSNFRPYSFRWRKYTIIWGKIFWYKKLTQYDQSHKTCLLESEFYFTWVIAPWVTTPSLYTFINSYKNLSVFPDYFCDETTRVVIIFISDFLVSEDPNAFTWFRSVD